MNIPGGLSPLTTNILSILASTPIMVLKKDSGSNRAAKVREELKSLDGSGFRVFENNGDLCIVADGSGRRFLV